MDTQKNRNDYPDKSEREFPHEWFSMIWGFALFCGGTDAVRNGITLKSVIYFAGYLLTGAMVWSVFHASAVAFQEETKTKRILYQLIFLLVITYISTGAPWR